MKETGYINATKLIALSSKNKKFNDWTRGKNTEELINELSSDTEISVSELLIPITTSSKKFTEIRGTYVHPNLIPHIASRASPKFAVKVSKIINEYFIREAIDEKEKEFDKKNDKIDELNDKVDKLLSKNNKMDKRIKRLLSKNNDLYDQNEEILDKVYTISNDKVISTSNSKDINMFLLIKNNDDLKEYNEDTILYEYHVLRVMKKSCKIRLINHKNRHPNMEIIMKISFSPNSMNLWTRIKKRLGMGKNRKIDYDNCKFNLHKKNYSQENLINDIKEIHNERFNYEDIDI